MKARVSRFDTSIARYVGHIPRSFYGFFVVVGAIIRPIFWISLSLLIAVYYWYIGAQVYFYFALFIALSIPLSTVLKLLFRRKRPVTIYTENMRVKSYSFPSSHSYAAALGSFLMVVFLTTLMPSLAGIFGLFGIFVAFVVGVSRIYVGAHYPSDVLGGIVLGCVIASSLLFGLAL